MIKELQTVTEQKGFKYIISERTKTKAFVEVYDTRYTNDFIGYEIWLIRIQKVTDWIGHKKLKDSGYTHKEVPPSDTDFGGYGWYFPKKQLQNAIQKYKEK